MLFTRRSLIATAGAGVTSAAALSATGSIDLALPGGPSLRPLTPRFPQKGEMIVQRVRPPLLETPFEVFRVGTITPNDRHFVRWSGGVMPTMIDVTKHRLAVRGAVKSPLSLTLDEVLRAGEHVEVVAVNQCAGNGRGFQEPRVPGAQWGHGAMSNARWRGVRLRDVLEKAAIGGDAKRVRFAGLDVPAVDGAPQKIKSLPIDVARRDDVLIAFAMNGEALPILNGFPLRLVVPGWFATYWIKMLSDIEVLNTDVDDSYFMAKTYRLPTVPVKPGDKDFPTVPITTMPPRSWITSHRDGGVAKGMGSANGTRVEGFAMGGDAGVAKVELIVREGERLGYTIPATLGPDEGPFGFRRWHADAREFYGPMVWAARCTNANGVTQPDEHAWNPSGYARHCVERIRVSAT